MLPESRQMFPESRQMFPESRQMFPESRQMFHNSETPTQCDPNVTPVGPKCDLSVKKLTLPHFSLPGVVRSLKPTHSLPIDVGSLRWVPAFQQHLIGL
jgi:hypothetical protein